MSAPPQVDPQFCVSPEQLKKLVEEKNVYVIDVRNDSEINGKFIAADKRINIPFNDLEAKLNLNDKDFKQEFGIDKPSNDGAEVVFHCGLGGRSARSVHLANSLNFSKVRHLSGGYKAWAEKCGN